MARKESNNLGLDFFKGKILNDSVLIEPMMIEEDNGLVKPQGYEDKAEFAKVLMVGEGRLFDNGTRLDPSVKVGDTIFFQKYSAQKVRLGGKDYLIIREEDIYWRSEG